MAADFAVEIEGTAVEAAEFEPVAVRRKADPTQALIIATVGAIEVVWLTIVALLAYWVWTVL